MKIASTWVGTPHLGALSAGSSERSGAEWTASQSEDPAQLSLQFLLLYLTIVTLNSFFGEVKQCIMSE